MTEFFGRHSSGKLIDTLVIGSLPYVKNENGKSTERLIGVSLIGTLEQYNFFLKIFNYQGIDPNIGMTQLPEFFRHSRPSGKIIHHQVIGSLPYVKNEKGKSTERLIGVSLIGALERDKLFLKKFNHQSIDPIIGITQLPEFFRHDRTPGKLTHHRVIGSL